ncbi:MAG: hypothetical protein SVS15_00920 [Thermodesulfobacteriota bacterium]|nr:hypothetical protein [Thermodesulfobacteriota bacterium]
MKASPFNQVLFAALMAGCLLAVPACRNKDAKSAMDVTGTLAVAGFTQPRHSWELLAGYVPKQAPPVDAKILYALDDALVEALKQTSRRGFLRPRATRQCQEIVVFEQKGSRSSALKYWINVGHCMPADYLLVPQLLYWREREGNQFSVNNPASVVMELFLVDVKNGQVKRYHFEETQRSLSENILDADKFLSRGGKWIPAMDLAREGMARGLDELGL